MICIVTGASRGAGKGIATALGERGATVYVTGRSLQDGDHQVGGTVTETASLITQSGGTGIAVALDHSDDAAVAEFFARISRDHGCIDILVNNAAAVSVPQSAPFWDKPLQHADLITVGLRSHYVASYHAAPLLIANGKGLIVNTGHYGAVSYYQGPAYGAQKAGSDKMIADMAKELRDYRVAAISIWMGSLDTERARAHINTLPPAMRPTAKRESPQFTGRLIAELYRSDGMMALSGRALIGAELGLSLGVVDIDGERPLSNRYMLGGPPELHASLQ